CGRRPGGRRPARLCDRLEHCQERESERALRVRQRQRRPQGDGGDEEGRELTAAATGILAHWHPVTRDFGLIQAPPQQLLAAFTAGQAGIGSSYPRRTIETSLADAFAALPPLSMEKRRLLFVATTAGWTAFFASGIQGSDPMPVMGYLAREMAV